MSLGERITLGFLAFLTFLVFAGVGGGAGYGLWYLVNTRNPEQEVIGHDNFTQFEEGVVNDQWNSSIPPETLALVNSAEENNSEVKSLLWRPTSAKNISQSEFEELSQRLWDLDTTRLSVRDLGLNIQQQTNASHKTDVASGRLFSPDFQELSSRSPTFSQFLGLLGDFIPFTKTQEEVTSQEHLRILQFVDSLLQTTLLREVHHFLIQKGYSSDDLNIWKSQLMEAWFNLYTRSPKYEEMDSSGFEHVFVGERRGMKTLGFHNWIQAYMEEQNGRFEYYGYISYKEPVFLNLQFSWREGFKKQSSMFLGTSPEFDFSIYTVCALTRINRSCNLQINDQQVLIQTWDVNHKPGVQIATAFIV